MSTPSKCLGNAPECLNYPKFLRVGLMTGEYLADLLFIFFRNLPLAGGMPDLHAVLKQVFTWNALF